MSLFSGSTSTDRKKECIRRLELWRDQGLLYCVLQKFKRKNTLLYYSDPLVISNKKFGSLFYLDNCGEKAEWLSYISQFEEYFDATVYHVIHGKLKSGHEVLYFLYVNNSEIEWEEERQDILNNHPFVFCLDLTRPEESQFGNITCKISGGGMIRA